MTAALDMPPRLVPSTGRALRGVIQALEGIDSAGRPDIAHVLDKARMVLRHLATRVAPETLVALVALEREIAECAGTPAEACTRADAGAPEDYDALIGRLTIGLGHLRASVSRAGLSDIRLATRAQRLEARFYALLMPPPAAAVDDWPPLTADAFEAYLLARFPGVWEGVESFTRLVGGFQKETIVVEARGAAGGIEPLVIRAEKPDRLVRFTASAIADEHAIVRALWERGMPVAEPLWLEVDESRLGRRFMVSRRATGRNTGSAYGDSQSFPPALARSFVATLARIHNQPIDAGLAATALGQWCAPGSLAANTRAEIAGWRHQIWLHPLPASPAFARLFDWLEANVPEDEAPARLVHNDFGPHNILVEGDAVSAVLDWEVVRIGDPAEDLSFFLQCCGGAIDREAAIAEYQALSGNPITRFRMAYFDVLSIAKVLVSTLSATAMYDQTEPALIDWMQMPLIGHGAYQGLVEARIAVAEAARGQ